MRDCLLTRVFLGLLVVLPTVTGCHALHPTPTIPIVVRDAETKEPIPGAEIRLWSPADNSTGRQEPTGTTGPDGVARIKADYSKVADVLIGVTAQDYLPDQVDRVLAGKVPGSPPGGAIVEMFRGPRPVIEVIVPSDFRGEFKVEVKPQEDTQNPERKRVFTCKVPPAGLRPAGGFDFTPVVVHVSGPPILSAEGRIGPEFHGLYADMTPMPAEPKDKDIVMRWVRSEGPDQYFIVGTKVDQLSAQRAAEKQIGPREKSSPNKSGGKGGGGGARGGMGGGGMGGGGMGGGGMTPSGVPAGGL